MKIHTIPFVSCLSSIPYMTIIYLASLHANTIDRILFIINCYHKKWRSLQVNDIWNTKVSADLPCHYFNGLDSRFPLLESLTLHKCWWEDTEHMNIFSQHLKRFVLFENYMQLKVSMNFPNLLQATFILWDAVPSYLRLNYLGEFLQQFDCSRKTSLYVTDAKVCVHSGSI